MKDSKISEPDFDFPSVEKIASILQLNQEVVRDILKDLIGMLPLLMDKLCQMIHAQNREGVKNTAHTIKGACGNLRIESLRKLSEETEMLNPFTVEEALVKYEKIKECFNHLKLFYEGRVDVP